MHGELRRKRSQSYQTLVYDRRARDATDDRLFLRLHLQAATSRALPDANGQEDAALDHVKVVALERQQSESAAGQPAVQYLGGPRQTAYRR